MSLTVLIAPSGFKECLDAQDVTDAMARGVTRAWPDATVLKAPIADGGEGFARALCGATGGRLHDVTVTGPVGEPVPAVLGFLGGCVERTAVLEIAAACGLSLVPPVRRDPTLTTSYGVGELIRAALDLGAERILIGCGDSGVNDGGAGMVQALGGKLLTADGHDIGYGAAGLLTLDGIDLSGLDPRLAAIDIDATVNWHNALLGPRGVARVYGPQKGARPEQIAQLEAALEIYSAHVAATTGVDVAGMNGAGASGGLGAGLAGCLGASLHPRYNVVFKYLDLDQLLQRADLVLTAEGALDGQTPHGKVPAEVGRRAAAYGIPVIALAGTVGAGAARNLSHGIAAFGSIQAAPVSLSEAMSNAAGLLADASEQAVRMVGAGLSLGANSQARSGRHMRHACKTPRSDAAPAL
jgi:glycerate kinase